MILHTKNSALSCTATVLVIVNFFVIFNLSLVNDSWKEPSFDYRQEEPCGENGNQKLNTQGSVGISYDDLFSSNATGIKVNTSAPTDPPPERLWLRSRLSIQEEEEKNSSIPMKIHKIYLQRDGQMQKLSEMSPNLRAAHRSWRVLNPGYEMQYFDLNACRKYLALHFHPIFLRAFDCLQAFASKADFMRLLIVYKEGGW